ncbi:MAG: carboxypeptidase-like regulatory domain-containing protein [Winogradskyella sp.]|uniref:carboxypeptidase-like regulatory domain-containing protein n=1 Tax=Winogradskyella sp. TaxID=1883156 RepID=UPI0025E067EA|nr:carboxypeptidase-like regulatory domain-containing protein [Winogradskyella sp.]NRB58815.1 carboxypeptidase-like regulatory domain-containing protein [Winogradskyella sp.]
MRLLFLLFPILLFSQSQTAKGVVLDKETNAPVPYVNISILASQSGTSSDEDGTYSLDIKKDDLNKIVKLSSLGYEDSSLTISMFLNASKIYLKSKSEVLDEVFINEKIDDVNIVVNEIEDSELCQGYGSMAENPWIMALYFPYNDEYEKTEFLKSVKFHFGNFKNKKSKFRLRLFSVGKDSLPGEDILKENVIVSLKKKQKFAEVDISEYYILFPYEGVYVAFEWLYIPYNVEEVTYHFENKKKEKRLKYHPILSSTCEEAGKFTVATYVSGRWIFYSAKKYKSEEKSIPAISLTLSN